MTNRRSPWPARPCSLFAYCGWYDILLFGRVDGQNSIYVDMDGPHAPQDVTANENLAVRAYHFAVQHFGDLPAVTLQLTKNSSRGGRFRRWFRKCRSDFALGFGTKKCPLPLADDPIVPQIRASLGADTYPIFEGQARIWTGTGINQAQRYRWPPRSTYWWYSLKSI